MPEGLPETPQARLQGCLRGSVTVVHESVAGVSAFCAWGFARLGGRVSPAPRMNYPRRLPEFRSPPRMSYLRLASEFRPSSRLNFPRPVVQFSSVPRLFSLPLSRLPPHSSPPPPKPSPTSLWGWAWEEKLCAAERQAGKKRCGGCRFFARSSSVRCSVPVEAAPECPSFMNHHQARPVALRASVEFLMNGWAWGRENGGLLGARSRPGWA